MRKFYKHLLIGLLLCSATVTQAATMSFTTNKAVGETFAIAMNPGLTVTVTWANGEKETFVTDGSMQTLTLASSAFTLETDTEVTSLYVAGNGLTNMDLTNISSSLKKLYCGNNELVTLNLTNFKNLAEIDAQGNKLTTFKVYGPQIVNGSDNQLATFAVSLLPRLKQVYLADNQLKGLGVSSMTGVEQLFLQRNAIKTLKLNKCTSLKVLSVSNNDLTALDTKGLNNLTDIWAGDNELKQLDVTSCGSLQSLVVPNSGLTTVTWNEDCKKTLSLVDLSNNSLFYNSFPTTRNNKVLTTAILAPQNPYPLVEEGYVYTNEEYNWGNGKYEPMSTNGWGQSSAPMISIIDSNNNELTESKTAEGGDYKNYIRRITFWDSAFGKTVSIKATSSYYPDIVLTTTPFLVTTPTGINGVTTNNNQEKPAVYYNLNGQRVDKPTHGIYIANGKKVIIR